METGMSITNAKQMIEMLKGLNPALKSKVVIDGLQAAGRVINDEAKRNLFAARKFKSKTNYSYYSRAFRVDNYKARNANELGGVKVGVTKEGYKLRWIQWGTKERSYYNTSTSKVSKSKLGSKHRTGAMKGTNFFYAAVQSKQKEAFEIISSAIIKSLEDNVNKYK